MKPAITFFLGMGFGTVLTIWVGLIIAFYAKVPPLGPEHDKSRHWGR